MVNPSNIERKTLNLKLKDWVIDYDGTAYPDEIILREGDDYGMSVRIPACKI